MAQVVTYGSMEGAWDGKELLSRRTKITKISLTTRHNTYVKVVLYNSAAHDAISKIIGMCPKSSEKSSFMTMTFDLFNPSEDKEVGTNL